MQKRKILNIHTIFFVPLALFFTISSPLFPAESPPTLAIMNFTNRSQNPQWQWLFKGLADMLITDLSRIERFNILEREKMQKFLDEMNLSSTGLIDKNTAARFGKMAKVEKALFGSYLVEENSIKIEAHIIDIETQKVERVEWVKGKTNEFLDLEKKLAMNIIKNLHIKLTEAELASLKYKPTDSIDAATHFY